MKALFLIPTEFIDVKRAVKFSQTIVKQQFTYL